MIGGIGPTSIMVEWVMTEIMLNLEVMKKFHEELPRVVGVNITIEEFQVPILLIPFRTCFGWFNGTKYFGIDRKSVV